MFAFPPLRNIIFPRALALRLPAALCSPNAFQSRYYARAKHLAHCHPPLQCGPFHTKRRRHLTIPAPFNGQLTFKFHIDFVPIVLLHIGFASSTTPHSIASDPAEEEALLCLEQGTQKLEEGDVEGAKNLYQRSVDIKRNASSLFNLGVTHYHLSSYSKLIVAIWNSTPFEEEFDKAILSWTSAIELQPSSADAHTSSHVSPSSDAPYPNLALIDRPGERLLESSSIEARTRPPTSPVITLSLVPCGYDSSHRHFTSQNSG